MALSLSISLDTGIQCPSAYARISSIMLTHSELVVYVETFASVSAREQEKPTIRSGSYSLPFTSPVSLVVCYDLLKQVEEFSSSVDC